MQMPCFHTLGSLYRPNFKLLTLDRPELENGESNEIEFLPHQKQVETGINNFGMSVMIYLVI